MSISGSFGQVEFGNETNCKLRTPSGETVACTHQSAEWIPPERYSKHLPPEFSIRLDCYLGVDGHRRFQPESGDWRSLIVNCFMAGVAIRTALEKLPQDHRTNVRVQFYASQWMKHRQDYLTRRFRYSRDLFVRPSKRAIDSSRHVMAEISAFHPALDSIKSVREMSPTDSDGMKGFYNGLYQIAKSINVKDWTTQQFKLTIRDSLLLHKNSLLELTQVKLEEVNERLTKKIMRQFDHAPDRITEWLTSSGTNLPTVLKRQSGEVSLTRQEVNTGLFELGWRGFEDSAINVNATMRMVRNAIEDLNQNELSFFDSLYLNQSRLCDFPVLLLLDRHDFLAPALADIWNGGDIDKPISAIQNLLYFYGSMVRHRRTADRVAANCHQTPSGQKLPQYSYDDALTGSFTNESIQQAIVEGLGLRCNGCESDSLEITWKIVNSEIEIQGICRKCKQSLPRSTHALARFREFFDSEDLSSLS